jgi:hypothetical protein
MEKFLILRKSGILDYLLLEMLNFNSEENIFDNIGRQLIKIIFIIYLIYYEFKKKRKYQLKGLVTKTNYFQIVQIILFQMALLLDRKESAYVNIQDSLDTFSFIGIFYTIRRDLKS